MIFKYSWLDTTLRSFIGIFGYNSIVMSYKIYNIYFLVWLISIIGCIIQFKKLFIYNKKEKNKYILNYIFVLSIIIPILLSIIYSYMSDFQPQGRYIVGIIVPFTYFVVSGIKGILEKIIKNEKIRRIIIVLLIMLLIVITLKALFNYVIPVYK